MRRRLSFPTRAICAVLAASLIITAPGLPCYQALAAASQARLTPRAAAPQLGLPATLGSDPGQAPLAAALEASGAIPALGTTALDVPVDLAAPAAPIAALEAAPAPTPAASIRREEPAGERAAASPEKKPVEGALRALARDAAPEAAASSPIGALSALGRVFFGAADKPAGPEDGVALPGGAAPSPAAPGLAPESRRLPLADLVSFLVASKESDREDLARAIRDGEPVRAILARAPGRADYWRDLIQDFAQSQFSDQSRPIVELVTNSIDASRGDFPKEVDVRVSPAATEVSDRGKGMDLRTVLEKLLIPLISGKEGEPTTGRFGVGFFSILQYLKGPESRIEVSTSDGREAYRIVLALDGREPTIAFERLPDASSRGTTVSIRHPLDEAHTGEVLVDALGFNTQSLVRLNGRAINAQAVAAAGAQGSPLLQLAGEGIKLLHGPEGDGRARLSVNGVTIFSEALEGKNVPGTFILDMAVDTQLSVSRNMILVDSYARDQVRRAVDLAAAQPEPFPLVNALTPLIAALQAHNPSPRVEDNLELYLRSKASELAAGSERTLLPDVDLAHELAVESPAFLHPTLFSNLKGHAWPFGEYADFRPRLGGKHRRMLLVPVKTGSGLVVGEYGDVLFLNERHKPAGLVGKALLAAYLRTEGIVGTIRVPRSWWRAALALPLAPLRWLADAVLVFTPRKLADLVYGVKEALLGRKPERAKGFSEQEAKKFKETLRTQERLFLNWFSIAVFFLFAPTIVTGALHFVSPGLVKVLEPFSLLFSMVLNAKYGGALSQGVLRVMRFLRPYGARWGMLNLALPLYFLAYIPLGVASILLTGSPALAEALRVPVVFGLPVLLFLISIRSLLLQWALAAADSLYLAARALPLVWRWFALPTQIRARLRSNLSLRPASWALAVFLALSLSSKEGRAWAAAEGAPARLEAALERVRADPPSYLGIAQGLRLSGSDPALAVDLLADYDAAYFKAYLEMAGTFARRFPSLRLKPGLHGKYSALWRQDLLRQDRASLLKILASLARLSGARGQDIPRTLRPYLLHLLGLNVTRGLAFTQAAEIPEEARAGALEFDLSALLSHHLKGDVLLKSRDEVAAAVAEAAPPMRAKVAARALSNSVNFQSANPYIFMRELAQNVMDEADARQAPPQKRLLQVRTQVADGEVSLSLKDGLGMDFERLVNFLLLPNASTKRGERKAIGQYGHGFLTVLAGAKEVLVRTGTGDGRTLYARLVPRREGNKVVEVRATLAENAEAFAGTEVTWTKESSDPELDAAHLKSQAITLAGLVDERELRVDYDGAPLNKAKEAIGRAATPRGELDLFEFPEENSVVQRGLYIKDLDEEYTRFLPALVRDILLERGIVVQLPRGLRLTRDRGDIVFKNDVLPELGAALGQAALSALVGMYLKGDVAIDQLFPKDFLKDARQHAEAVPEAVLEDVARLNRGEPVADAALYQDPTNLAMLLASVPAIKLRFSARVRGKVSLLWAVKALEEGRIHWLQLPPAFSDLVVGKTLLKILLRYAVRLLIAAVALYFLWHAALAALAGGPE
ncbi:MAG TPA: hypothetical protein VNI01_14995, partial [Elusimicrobiota bacterium]|nr:hypothetical protein [Elusimicrobiota bacterium]